VISYGDYKEAVEGEGWAIGDYKDLLKKAETQEEKDTIEHIVKDEQEHLGLLLKLRGIVE
jgi:rubrerythrin